MADYLIEPTISQEDLASLNEVAHLVPIVPGKKYPTGKNWNEGGAELKFLEGKRKEGFGFGVIAGLEKAGTRIYGLDIDVLDPVFAREMSQFVRNFTGIEYPERIGKAPKNLFVFTSTDRVATLKTLKYEKGDYTYGIDVIGSKQVQAEGEAERGAQFVAHGIHPDTDKPYHWPGSKMTDPWGIPSMSGVQLDAIVKFFNTRVAEMGCQVVKTTRKNAKTSATYTQDDLTSETEVAMDGVEWDELELDDNEELLVKPTRSVNRVLQAIKLTPYDGTMDAFLDIAFPAACEYQAYLQNDGEADAEKISQALHDRFIAIGEAAEAGVDGTNENDVYNETEINGILLRPYNYERMRAGGLRTYDNVEKRAKAARAEYSAKHVDENYPLPECFISPETMGGGDIGLPPSVSRRVEQLKENGKEFDHLLYSRTRTKNQEKKSYIISGLLPDGNVSGAVVAPSASGKTFFAFRVMLAVALGVHFEGRATVQYPVIYVGNEDKDNYQDRMTTAAMQIILEANKRIQLAIINDQPSNSRDDILQCDVTDEDDVYRVLRVIDSITDKMIFMYTDAMILTQIVDEDEHALRGVGYVRKWAMNHRKVGTKLHDGVKRFRRCVVLLDPWANASGVDSENDSADFAKATRGLNTLKPSGAASIIFHHSGVSDKTRIRGSSAAYAALDFTISLINSKVELDQELNNNIRKGKKGDDVRPLEPGYIVEPPPGITLAEPFADRVIRHGGKVKTKNFIHQVPDDLEDLLGQARDDRYALLFIQLDEVEGEEYYGQPAGGPSKVGAGAMVSETDMAFTGYKFMYVEDLAPFRESHARGHEILVDEVKREIDREAVELTLGMFESCDSLVEDMSTLRGSVETNRIEGADFSDEFNLFLETCCSGGKPLNLTGMGGKGGSKRDENYMKINEFSSLIAIMGGLLDDKVTSHTKFGVGAKVRGYSFTKRARDFNLQLIRDTGKLGGITKDVYGKIRDLTPIFQVLAERGVLDLFDPAAKLYQCSPEFIEKVRQFSDRLSGMGDDDVQMHSHLRWGTTSESSPGVHSDKPVTDKEIEMYNTKLGKQGYVEGLKARGRFKELGYDDILIEDVWDI